jgi:hypothetical protein
MTTADQWAEIIKDITQEHAVIKSRNNSTRLMVRITLEGFQDVFDDVADTLMIRNGCVAFGYDPGHQTRLYVPAERILSIATRLVQLPPKQADGSEGG